MGRLVAAVDVGTGSARAGIFDAGGALLGRAEQPITMHRPAPGRYEQESGEIWEAVGAALRGARSAAGARPAAVAGLAFDATCSLVLRDTTGAPLAASDDAPGRRDTIAWLDHRALDDAGRADAAREAAPLIARLGGSMSPEFQLAKLMWLKRACPEAWARLGAAYDLADHLAERATGAGGRSRCTLACKWGWDTAGPGWPAAALAGLGLGDMAQRCAMPPAPAAVGRSLGPLKPEAAAELGLEAGCAVAAGLIDAHAGALGSLGGLSGAALDTSAALVAGTSNCIMAFLAARDPVPGLWGPMADGILPGRGIAEGGQSASGALLDHVCRLWGQGTEPGAEMHARVLSRIAELRAAEGPDLAPDLHVLPDVHGSRSPLPDAAARGAVAGLSLDASFDGLCRLYWRTAVALALGLRSILDHMAAAGIDIRRLHLAGGHARSPLLVGLYADATGRPVAISRAPDPVLLGGAMAAAAGAGLHPDLAAAAGAMAQPFDLLDPDKGAVPRMARDARIQAAMRRHRAEIADLGRRLED